ncbi:MAG TPA: hypothetical protein VNO30_20045 [Kofleriaceae bacterium]|nr:hypothetical protein [Kofleriaceae bacterium]
MAINNLVAGHVGVTVRRADVVFHITNPPMSRDPRPVGHAGISIEDVGNYHRGQPLRVVHMAARFVAEHVWQPATHINLSVDVAGSVDDLEAVERDDVIAAAAMFRREVSLLGSDPDVGCYWQGAPSPSAHPDHPNSSNAYAFSCTTFVQHCYSRVRGELVDGSRPITSSDERTLLASLGLRTQESEFRRLSCGQMICALEQLPQRFPFVPGDGDWSACSDAVTFARPLTSP